MVAIARTTASATQGGFFRVVAALSREITAGTAFLSPKGRFYPQSFSSQGPSARRGQSHSI